MQSSAVLPYDRVFDAEGTPQRDARLRVLEVALRYFPFMGGVETHVYEVSRRLARAGVDVTVLTTDTTGALPAAEEVEGVQIRRVRAWPEKRDYFFAPGLYRAITGGSWDLIHIQGVHTLVAPLAMAAAWQARLPYVVSFHSGGHTSRLRTRLRNVQWSVLRPLLGRADRLIGVSQFEAQHFAASLRLPPSQFTVIPNGATFAAPAAGAPPSAGTTIVSVGRLERYKGHHRVIEALPLVRAQQPDARLLILGAGPYEAELRQLAARLGVADQVEIRLIPSGDRQQMATVVSNAALMTLLSEYEAHPIAVMEAVALGRPVLVAGTSGLQELADRGLARAIPLASTPAEVAAAIAEQLRRPLNPAAVDLPTWDGCAADLHSLYEAVARRAACAS